MAETLTLDDQRTTTLDFLTAFTPVWLAARSRYERSIGDNPELPSFGQPLNTELATEYKDVYKQMNDLLEDYFLLNSGVELSVAPSLSQEQEKELAWLEYDGA